MQIDLETKDKKILQANKKLEELKTKLLNTEQGFDELKSVLY